MAQTFNDRFSASLTKLIEEEIVRLSDIIISARTADLHEIRLQQGRIDGFARALELLPIALSIANGDRPLNEVNT